MKNLCDMCCSCLPSLLCRTCCFLTFGFVATVMSALSETEEENTRLQDEIQHLLDEQDEQQELRTELGEQLLERRDLMAKIAAQARADNDDSEGFLKRMKELMEESDREKQDFKQQMERLDQQLAELTDDESGGMGAK